KFSTSLALLVSLSSSTPHSHECHRSDRSFLTTAPHPEQSCDVMYGLTKRIVRPAHAAFALTIFVNVAHPASRIDLLSPALPEAPLGRYLAVSASCLGFGRLVRLAVCKSSNTII